jgi:transcriptional regulator with XRE-family HTH domain
MAPRSGSIGRRRLGIELRELRTKKQMTLDDVAGEFGWSASKASRMERGLVPVSPRDVRDLAKLYGVDDLDEINLLVSMAATSRQRDWWHRFDDVLPRQFSIYLGFEGDAQSIHNYESLFIPGLLQTAEYARALADATADKGGDDLAARKVEARMLRQALITGHDAPRLHAIIDESALRRVVGGPGVMREQLNHLLEAAKRPNVVIQVIPFQAGAYMSMDGGFIILRFPDIADGDVVCIDILSRSLYLDDAAEVRRYTAAWEDALATAAAPLASVDMVRRMVEELQG